MTKDRSSEIDIGESIIKNSDCEKLQGIKVDLKLHFRRFFKKVNRKLRAVTPATS